MQHLGMYSLYLDSAHWCNCYNSMSIANRFQTLDRQVAARSGHACTDFSVGIPDRGLGLPSVRTGCQDRIKNLPRGEHGRWMDGETGGVSSLHSFPIRLEIAL